MKVDNEMGVLETADVEDTLQARFDDVRACYERAGKAREYAGGRVLLHFLVDGTGHAEDVWVVESSLGNYDVERCLVEFGRSVVFAAPSGHKSTTFDYPVEFRSTKGVDVLDIDGLKIDRDLATLLAAARGVRAPREGTRERHHVHRAERLPGLGRPRLGERARRERGPMRRADDSTLEDVGHAARQDVARELQHSDLLR